MIRRIEARMSSMLGSLMASAFIIPAPSSLLPSSYPAMGSAHVPTQSVNLDRAVIRLGRAAAEAIRACPILAASIAASWQLAEPRATLVDALIPQARRSCGKPAGIRRTKTKQRSRLHRQSPAGGVQRVGRCIGMCVGRCGKLLDAFVLHIALPGVDMLTAAIIVGDVDAPPLAAHLVVMGFRIIDHARGPDFGNAQSADG